MKPKLLITTSTLPSDEHDPEPRFVLDLAFGLSRHFEVCVLAPRHQGASETAAFGDVEVRRYAYAPRRWETLTYPGAILDRLRQRPARWGLAPLLLAGLYRHTRHLLASRKFACVHAHWLVPQAAVQSLFAPSRLRTPYIGVAHGADVYAMNGIAGAAMLRRAVSEASGIVAASRPLVATLRERFPAQMARRPTAVIGMGVDTQKFSPAARGKDANPFSGLRRPLILYVGRLSEKKGIAFLLRAMAVEPLKSLAASLAIIGSGPLDQSLKALCKEMSLGDRVHFYPACAHDSLAEYIAAADLLCVPSVTARDGNQEARPTVLVEAAACGVAAVASDVGGIGDWIDDGLNGRLVPPSDPAALSYALADLLRQPERMQQMGRVARQKALDQSWSAVADRYAEFTLDAIGRRLHEPPSQAEMLTARERRP
ncbi:MAG: glycosyltransferase [Methyloceanibacter sp.]